MVIVCMQSKCLNMCTLSGHAFSANLMESRQFHFSHIKISIFGLGAVSALQFKIPIKEVIKF